MEKKALCILLVICVIMPICANAGGFSVASMDSLSEIITIDVDRDADVAFVESKLPTKERAFTHKYESNTRYSSTEFDMLVINYFESNAYPIFRLWINYCADDFLNINSVTFELDGVKYTFSGIADRDWLYSYDDGIEERLLIKFGISNLSFLAALENKFSEINDISEIDQLDISLTLHGSENITVKLDSGFWLDFFALKSAWILSGGATEEYLKKVTASEMKEH